MSKCKKCENTKNYNFAINNGLCDGCIGAKLKALEAQNQRMYDRLNAKYEAAERSKSNTENLRRLDFIDGFMNGLLEGMALLNPNNKWREALQKILWRIDLDEGTLHITGSRYMDIKHIAKCALESEDK